MTGDRSDSRDYVLDLSGMAPAGKPQREEPAAEKKVAYLSIHFRCCGVYAPIYKNAAGTAYAGNCPRCHRPATIAIGAGGSSSRIFAAE